MELDTCRRKWIFSDNMRESIASSTDRMEIVDSPGTVNVGQMKSAEQRLLLHGACRALDLSSGTETYLREHGGTFKSPLLESTTMLNTAEIGLVTS